MILLVAMTVPSGAQPRSRLDEIQQARREKLAETKPEESTKTEERLNKLIDSHLLERLGPLFAEGPIATVATCSGTDEAAAEVARRTGAVAEAMEGAAVVHAARRLGVPAIELRAVSNTTGRRDRQVWDLPTAMTALGEGVAAALEALREGARQYAR